MNPSAAMPWDPDRVVCRNRLTIWTDDVVWSPLPHVRTAGGHAYVARNVDRRIWDAINDARTVRQIADKLWTSVDAVLHVLEPLLADDAQVLQLRDKPARAREPGLERLRRPPRPPAERSGQSLTEYHLSITDGATHFDDVETTIAHVFALPHPGLQGVPYGRRLRERLQPDGLVVELGCGDGELAEAWGADAHYLRVDLSPELLRTQKARNPASPGVLADGSRLPLRDASVPLLVSNEVIADLPDDRAADVVREVVRVLRPGGRAWLSEFGDLSGERVEAVQLDHGEVSIDFAHLLEVARQAGAEARFVPLEDAMGFDMTAKWLWRPSWEALRALARSRGVHLKARAYTPKTLAEALPWTVHGLRWVPLIDEGPGPLVTRFGVLEIRR